MDDLAYSYIPSYEPIQVHKFGAYMVVLYIITKFLYLVNVVAQLYILDKLLATEYSVYGFHVMRWMIQDHDWTNSPFVAFPRVTMCDFNVRRLGNIHRYTIQCVLPINLYNEKIFMFLWFWMVGVAFLSFFSLVLWILRAVSVADKTNYVRNHLKILGKLDRSSDRSQTNTFTRKFLRADGIFLMRLIGHNTDTLTVMEIIGALWDDWLGESDNANERPAASAPPDEDKGASNTYPELPEKEPLPID